MEVYEDAGVSGSNGIEDRIGLPELLADLNAGKFTDVVVAKLDRLARDLHIQEGLILKFDKAGGRLVAVDNPNLDSDDPYRKAFRQMVGLLAELEKNLIVARLRAGRIRKGANGGYASGYVAFGYDIQGEGRNSILVINETEADAVRWMYHRRADGWSNVKIAKTLTKNGVETKRGGTWAPTTVAKVLRNQRYDSHTNHGVPAILSEAEIAAVRGPGA